MPFDVLINDDEPALAQALETIFRKSGFSTRVAHSAEDAYRMIREKEPELLVTDLAMPGLSGPELIERMLEMDCFVPVITISGAEMPGFKRYPFFKKPFHANHLVEFIQAHIRILKDVQQIRALAERYDLDEARVGKVGHFNPVQGWGLLRVIGRSELLYVNAADIARAPVVVEGHPEYRQLTVDQVVCFDLEEGGRRGARARNVRIVYEERRRKG